MEWNWKLSATLPITRTFKCCLYLVLCWCWVVTEKSKGWHDKPWSTKPTLQTMGLHQTFLHTKETFLQLFSLRHTKQQKRNDDPISLTGLLLYISLYSSTISKFCPRRIYLWIVKLLLAVWHHINYRLNILQPLSL